MEATINIRNHRRLHEGIQRGALLEKRTPMSPQRETLPYIYI